MSTSTKNNAKITGTKNISLTANGERCGIVICGGPWVEGVNPDLIKIRPKKDLFPASFKSILQVENNSESMTDYFEADCIRLLPGHALYAAAKALV